MSPRIPMIVAALAVASMVLVAFGPETGTQGQVTIDGGGTSTDPWIIGDNVKAYFDGNKLQIYTYGEGTGKMYDGFRFSELFSEASIEWSGDMCMSESVTTIGANAFQGLNFNSFDISSNITSIGAEAYKGCSGLPDLFYRIQDLESIGESAFEGSNLSDGNIPGTVRTIGDYAFKGTNIASTTVGSNVTSLGAGAFQGCTSLTTVYIDASITAIGEETFESCSKLTSVTLPYSIESIGQAAFKQSGLTSFTIPSKVKSIDQEVFYGCTGLKSIEIPDQVTSIGKSAFQSSGLTSIEIPSTVTSVEDYAFYDCSKLETIKFGTDFFEADNSQPGDLAFEDCAFTEPDAMTATDTFVGRTFTFKEEFKEKRVFYADSYSTRYAKIISEVEDGLAGNLVFPDGKQVPKDKAYQVGLDSDGRATIVVYVTGDYYMIQWDWDTSKVNASSTYDRMNDRTVVTLSYTGEDTATIKTLARKNPGDAVTGVTSGMEKTEGGPEGRIYGLESTMQYRADGTEAWTDCQKGTKQVAPGKYQVRMAATVDTSAGTPATVYVGPDSTKLAGYGVTYNGGMQEYSPAGFEGASGSWIAIAYKDGQNRIDADTYAASVTPAGGYWAYVGTGDDAAYSGTKEVSWKITQKIPDKNDFVIRDEKLTYVWDGDSHLPTVTLDPEKYPNPQPDDVSSWLKVMCGNTDEPKDVASYLISVSVGTSQNFSAKTVSLEQSLSITQRTLSAGDFTVTIPENAVYNGQGHAPGVTTELDGGSLTPTVTYRKQGTTSSSAIDAGTYQIILDGDDTSNYRYPEGGITADGWTVTVDRAPVKISPGTVQGATYGQDETVTIFIETSGEPTGELAVRYNGDALKIKSYGVKQENDRYVASFVIDTIESGIPCGSDQPIAIQYPGDSNHGESSMITVSINIGKAPVEIEPVDVNPITYGETLHIRVKLKATGKLTGNVVFKYGDKTLTLETYTKDETESDTCYTYDIDVGIQCYTYMQDIPVGSVQQVTACYPGDSNHEASGTATCSVEIKKAPVAVSDFSCGAVTYGGKLRMDFLLAKTNPLLDVPIVKYGDVTLTLAENYIIYYSNDGSKATVVYDTTVNQMPCGSNQISISYPGDKYHLASTEYTGTVQIDKLAVDLSKITCGDAEYGDEMTIRIDLGPVGGFEKDFVVMYGDKTLPVTCDISENGDGNHIATIAYDTLEGIIPTGTPSEIEISYPGDDYHDAAGPVKKTVEISKAPVEVTRLSYDTTTYGQKMTMRITLESVGELSGDIAITCNGKALELDSCEIAPNGDGTYTATVVYDTSRGTVPAGFPQTVSVQYPGDADHEASDTLDRMIRIRSADAPVVPGEGEEIPIDPDKGGTDVETPAGDVRIDIIDDGGEEGDGGIIVVTVVLREADAGEEVSGEDRTFVMEVEARRVLPDGTSKPVTYRVTPSVNVDVPSGSTPEVTLYDWDGKSIGTRDVLTYTSDSVTFSTVAKGKISVRIGLTFVSDVVPAPLPEDTVEPEYPGTVPTGPGSWLDNGKTILIIAIIAAIVAELAMMCISKKR